MSLSDIFLELGLFSKLYFVAMVLFILGYSLRSIWIHRLLSRLGSLNIEESRLGLRRIESHITGLRQVQHISLGLGRALLAAQLSALLLAFSPVMRATDIQPWFDVPTFVILSQLCFLPLLILLVLDWLISAHLRHVTLSR